MEVTSDLNHCIQRIRYKILKICTQQNIKRHTYISLFNSILQGGQKSNEDFEFRLSWQHCGSLVSSELHILAIVCELRFVYYQ